MMAASGGNPEPAHLADHRFPLGLALAVVLATGAGLLAAGWGIQWGEAPPAPDALQLAWPYVNVALVWTWLLVWPAIALRRKRLDRPSLAWDGMVIAAGAIPSLGVAAFLSGVDGTMIAGALFLQAALGLFAMGAISWRGRIRAGALAGMLAAIGVALPIAAYLWCEYFAAASRAWIAAVPVIAATWTSAGAGNAWIAGGYALAGCLLLICAPRRAI